jgi:hypothetical protein
VTVSSTASPLVKLVQENYQVDAETFIDRAWKAEIVNGDLQFMVDVAGDDTYPGAPALFLEQATSSAKLWGNDVLTTANLPLSLTGAVAGQVLSFNGTTWVPVNAELAKIVAVSAQRMLGLSDMGGYLRLNIATANDLIIPTAAQVNFPIGTQINVIQVGDGQTTIAPEPGVVVNTTDTLKLRKKFSAATLVKVGTDEWDVMGDMEALS